MSYSKTLQKRLRAGRAARNAAKTAARGTAFPGAAASIDADTLAAIGEVHPDRYPKHSDPAKGQVYGGECNTTACSRHRAVFFNRGTYGLYCPDCARGQNGRDPVPISVPVKAKPSLAEMAEIHRAYMAEFSATRA